MAGVVKLPVPTPPESTLPPLAPAYQSIVAPDAGVALIFTVPLTHTEPFTGFVGAAGIGFTVAITSTLGPIQLVVVFLACTQYDVVPEMLGEVKLGPVPRSVPPDDALYHSSVYPLAAAARDTVPVPQRAFGVALGGGGVALTVAVTAVRLADLQLVAASLAST